MHWILNKSYVGQSVFLVHRSDSGLLLSGFSGSAASGAAMAMLGKEKTQRYLEYLRSTPFSFFVADKVLEHPIGKKVVEELGLERKIDLSVFAWFPSFNFVSASKEDAAFKAPDLRTRLAKKLSARIKARASEGHMIEVRVSFPHRAIALELSQLVTSASIEFLTQRELQDLDQSKGYLSGKLLEAEGQLKHLDDNFSKLDTAGDFLASIGSSGKGGLSPLGIAFQEAQLKLRENEKLIQSIKSQLMELSQEEGKKLQIDPDFIFSLRKEAETLTLKRSKLKAEGFAEDSYQMKVIQSQIETAEQALDRLVAKDHKDGNYETPWSYVSLTRKLKELNQENLFLSARLDTVKRMLGPDETGVTPSKRMRNMDYLAKRTDLQYVFYSELTKRLFDVDVRRIWVGNQLVVVEPPSLSKLKRDPALSRNLLIAFVLALVLFMTSSQQLEAMNPLVLTAKELEGMMLKVLGSVPDLTPGWKEWARNKKLADIERLAMNNQRSDTKEGLVFKHLRTRLIHAIERTERDVKYITVSSPNTHDGKTFVLLNLAVALARSGARVLIVDADLRSQRISQTLAPKASRGLVGKSGDLDPQAADNIVRDCHPGLDILPAGQVPEDPSEFFEGEDFAKQLHALGSGYDYVFVDTPPVVQFPEAITLASITDATLLIVCRGQTRIKQVANAAESFSSSSKTLWCVLNKAGNAGSVAYPASYPHSSKKAAA